MNSDRKHRIEIYAAALLLAWLSSRPSLAGDTAVHHIGPSPFQTHGAARLAPPPKSVTDACESLHSLRERSGVYRDKLDCVAVPFETTDLEISAEKHSDVRAKLEAAIQAAAPSDASASSTTKAVRTDAKISSLSKSPDLLPDAGAPSGSASTTPSAGYWRSLLECKNKGKVSKVSGFSISTYVSSNLMTEERAQTLVRGAGASDYFTAMASPRVVRVARSGPWKIGWLAVTLATGVIAGYQFMVCE